jgi:hypothetical protein
MSTSRYVEFLNKRGDVLRGFLHSPDSQLDRHVCILLLSPGIKGRVGPHRLYLKLAASLVARGYHVLRFDFFGLGDATGELGERVLADVYTSIQTGRYVDDAIAAMNWMQHTHDVTRFVGSGLCGGSISALLAASVDRRIELLLGIGMPSILDGGPDNWARALTQQQIAGLQDSYLRKLVDPRSLLRLMTGKSNYAAIQQVLRGWLASRSNSSNAPAEKPPPSSPDPANPLFAPAFLAMLRSGRRMLLVFSGNDRLHGQFEEHFEQRHEDQLKDLRDLYEVYVVKNANHVLSAPEWVEELCSIAGNWLDSQHNAS